MAPHNLPAEPVGPVNGDELAIWAQETEPQAARGIRQTTGRVRLHLGMFADAARARALAIHLDEAGYSVEIAELEVGSRRWHHVSQAQYATREDALAVRQSLQIFGGLSSAWVAE